MAPDGHTVLLVAANGCVRDDLRARLETAAATVCAEARGVASALRLARTHHPDACVLHVPCSEEGVAAARRLAHGATQMAVLVLAEDANGAAAAATLSAGAHGYLPADCDDRTLRRSLAAVMRGEAAVPRRYTRHLLRLLHHDVRPTLPGRRTAALTAREQEVLAFLHEGMTTGEIADTLVVEPVTVRSHVAAIVRKLGVRDRHEAVGLLGAP